MIDNFDRRFISADELDDFYAWLLVEYHADENDEPFGGAGYCVCDICQKIGPRVQAAANQIRELEDALSKLVSIDGKGEVWVNTSFEILTKVKRVIGKEES